MMSVSFAERLKQLREARGLSLRDLEAQSGVHYTTLSRYENERRTNHRVGVDELCRLATGLGVSLDELLRDQQPGQRLQDLGATVASIRAKLDAAQALIGEGQRELVRLASAGVADELDELATRRRRRDSAEEQYDPAEVARTKAEIQERTAASTWPDEEVTEEARQEMDTKAAEAVIRVRRKRQKKGKDGSGGAPE